ncbi:MAG: 2-hydroxyglutaryl-CoA dehydratase [Solirubrobacterales bacterium]
MIVTFPHLGSSYLAVKSILDSLEIPYIIPDLNCKTSMDTGLEASPEEICLPFKLMLGNLINAAEKGADTVIIPGSCGPCRFGEYCELLQDLLLRKGFNLDFIVIDNPSEIGKKEFISRFSKITKASNKSKLEKINAAFKGYKIIKLIENLDSKAKYLCGYEINQGECLDIIRKCKVNALNSKSADEMIIILNKYNNMLKNIKMDKNKNPLKIAIIGEIYTIIEPYSNMNIEEKLMKHGVSVIRRITPGWWLKDTILSPLGLNSLKINRAAEKYIPYAVGGYSRECIGETVLASKDGCDGAIQIFPMGCMPEIVSKSVLPTVSRDLKIPVMSLIMDEISGEAGYNTRIEAFIDLLERRKNNVLLRN